MEKSKKEKERLKREHEIEKQNLQREYEEHVKAEREKMRDEIKEHMDKELEKYERSHRAEIGKKTIKRVPVFILYNSVKFKKQ